MQKYETISLTSYDHLENTLEIYIILIFRNICVWDRIYCYETSNWNVELTWSFSVVSILVRFNSSLPSFTNIW